MRIAVNTRFLLPQQLEGFGWYTHEIVRRMALNHPEDNFLFLFDRPFDPKYIYSDNVKAVSVFPPARHPVLFYAWFEWAVPRALRQWRAEVFFSPDSMCSFRAGLPTLMTVHDIVPLHFPEQLPFVTRQYLLYHLPRFLQRADAIATVSEYVKQDMVNTCGIEPDKIHAIYNGCREGFKPLNAAEKQATRDQFASGQPYFFYTGAVHPRKNVHRLIQAFDLFKEKTGSPIKLLLAGRFAWQTGEVTAAYESAACQADIHFLGYVPEEDLHRLTASALGLAYLSISEGFGLPMVEAMQTDTPIVAARATCLPEIAGDAALLVDPYSVPEIAEAMEALWKNPALGQRLIEKARLRRELFSWDHAAETIYALLKELALKP